MSGLFNSKEVTLNDARIMTKSQFITKYTSPFLVQVIELKLNQALSRTSVVRKTVTAEEMMSMQNPKEIKEIFPIIKSGRNSFANKIIVGRAPVQDIVINHANISKFHAFFSSQDGLNFAICDHGSTNGSSLNGVRLMDSEPKPLRDGDIVTFADFSYTYYSSEAAYDFFKGF